MGKEGKIEKLESKQEKVERKIKAENYNGLEGLELIFDLEKIKEEWCDFYRIHNLQELADPLKNVEMELTPEQINLVKEKVKEGFYKMILLPPVEIQKQYLPQILDETTKQIPGLKKKFQYGEDGYRIYSFDKELRDEKIIRDKFEITNRPDNKPYLMLIKDASETSRKTRGKSAVELRKELKQKKEAGFTLQEYLIYQRDHVLRNRFNQNKVIEKTERTISSSRTFDKTFNYQDNPDIHPDTNKETFLLNSKPIREDSEAGDTLTAYWFQQESREDENAITIAINEGGSPFRGEFYSTGTHESVVLPIEPESKKTGK